MAPVPDTFGDDPSSPIPINKNQQSQSQDGNRFDLAGQIPCLAQPHDHDQNKMSQLSLNTETDSSPVQRPLSSAESNLRELSASYPLGQQNPLSPQLFVPKRPRNTIIAFGSVNLFIHTKNNRIKLPMNEFIMGILRSLGGSDWGVSHKLSSAAYLMSALKIAHLLADQLCKFEEEEEAVTAGANPVIAGENLTMLQLPSPGCQWSDQVLISLKKIENDDDCKMSVENNDFDEILGVNDSGLNETNGLAEDQDGFSPSDPRGLQDMLNSIIPDPSVWLDDEDQSFQAGQIKCEGEGGMLVNTLGGGFLDSEDNQENKYSTLKPCHGMLFDDKDLPQIEGMQGKIEVDAFQLEPGPGAQAKAKEFQANRAIPKTSPLILNNRDQLSEQGVIRRNDADGTLGCLCIVEGAELQLESAACTIQREDKRMRIHFLGLVFFELFSGGKRPIGPGIDPLDQKPIFASPTNLATAMNIIDAIGKNDKLFGAHSTGRESSVNIKNPKDASRLQDIGNVEDTQRKAVRSTSSSMSVEPLKSLGLPIALCDLVGNMIDCSKGDFSDDETYSRMADVQNDLKLMLESPGTYLYDLDLDLACKNGLQLDDDNIELFGRDEELTSLKKIYLRSISNRCECAIVCGASGIGKTALTHEFTQYAMIDEKCILLLGKFDKLQQSQPFSAIASAFNKYCDWLAKDENASIANTVSSTLKTVLGGEVNIVAKLVPSLTRIVGDKADVDHGCVDAPKRLRYLLCQFIEVISRSHNAPLILFMDDLQWADLSSIALINQIMLTSRRLLLLGCCRDDEMGKDHALWKMLDSVSKFGVNTTKIELDCMDRKTVNSMISQKLKLLPRLTSPLAEIVYHKTKGNPFFVGQLLIELSKEGLLRPSLSQCRWVWEEDKIQERKLPTDVVSFMAKSLNRLSKDVLSALCVLSCFGASSDTALVEKLETEIELPILGPLQTAVAEGILFEKDEKYYFVHDRVHEAVYNTMKPEETNLCHFKYGLALCTVAERDKDNSLIITAVGQINLGGPKAVSDYKQGLMVANLNLVAGKHAMALSDFFSAYWFFDNGISYLKKGHWESYYDLSMELYDGAARCALSNGNLSSLNILSEQVLHYAKCFEDKMSMLDKKIRLLTYATQFPKAIEIGKNVLSNLGEEVPKEITSDVVMSYFRQTSSMLAGMSDEHLLNHNLMTDSNKIMAMKFLANLFLAMNFARPSDQPVIAMKMVQLTLVHGLGPDSPLAFVYYGSFLAGLGNIREGYRFAKISKSLVKKIDARQVAGEVFIHSTQLMAYVEPVQSTIEFHKEGGMAAMMSGTTNFAIYNYFLHAGTAYWAGRKLKSVMGLLEECRLLAEQHKHLQLLALVVPTYQTVLAMIGSSDSTRSSSADNPVLDSISAESKADPDPGKKLTFFSKHAHFMKIHVAFMFRKYDTCRELAEILPVFTVGGNMFSFSHSIRTFYEGLVLFWIGREENDKRWIAKARESKVAIKKLVESSSSWNFENKLFLLEAEEQFCERNFELAESFYDAAISSARDHRFLNEEALSNELAGMFYFETGRRTESIAYFSRAIEKYREWEAYEKALSLEGYLTEIVK